MKKIAVGIDLGSRTSKIVFLENGKIIYANIDNTGVNPKITAEKLFRKALSDLQISADGVAAIYSTGYGRNIVPFADKKISEISCHAKGVNFLFPSARTVIDIGGQDSKVIVLGENGRVLDFVMNDRCAAGTGRFLEVAANILELTVADLGEISAKSQKKIVINSTCVVFAESEIIGLISQGEKIEDIIKSIHFSIAKRTKNMVVRLHWQKPVVFTGGLAKNIGMKFALEKLLETEILIPENSFITGALGAAVFAAKKM